MSLLLLGLVVFFAAHLVTTMRDLRQRLIARHGEVAYKIGYTVVSLAGFALIILGFSDRPYISVWRPPVWTQHAALTLMLPVFALLAAAYLPTGRIKKAVKHPMLLAVKIWAFAHLLANGDLASMILFSTFLAYAVYDRVSVKRRGLVPEGEPQVRSDVVAVAVGLAAYTAMVLWLHETLIGVPVLA